MYKPALIALVAVALVFAAAPAQLAAQAKSPPSKATVERKVDLLDINTATKKELMNIKELGVSLANKIVAGRPYKSTDELVQRKIISEATYKAIKDRIGVKQQ